MSSNGSRPRQSIGAVIIGRNEGSNLANCIRSLKPSVDPVVYVDSGSTDGSPQQAAQLGVCVVELDPSRPFTAARARNEGMRELIRQAPKTQFVQFVDGDCVVQENWIEAAVRSLEANPSVAIVGGRRRERHPHASVYNRLCDMEWNRSAGTAEAVGGDALIRVSAWRDVSGYDDRMIAGEEPEMCQRLRSSGWQVMRINQEMTLHDARMLRFSQWWQRNFRAGHAFAEGAFRAACRGQSFRWHQLMSIALWGLCLPLLSLLTVIVTGGLSVLLLLCAYGLLWLRIRRTRLAEGDTQTDASLYAGFCVLGKFPELGGMIRFASGTLLRRRTKLIEYR